MMSSTQATVQGMCFIPSVDEIFSSEVAATITVRTALNNSKFAMKHTIDASCVLSRHDAVVRCVFYPGEGEWVWCSSSSGEVFGVHLTTKKVRNFAKVHCSATVGPAIALGSVIVRRRAVQRDKALVVVSLSKHGHIALWDISSKDMFQMMELRHENSPHLQFVPQPSLEELAQEYGPPPPAGKGVLVSARSLVTWREASIIVVGMSDGSHFVVDCRNLDYPAVAPLSWECGTVLQGPTAAAVLAMDVDRSSLRSRHDECVLWYGCSDGSVGKAHVRLSVGSTGSAIKVVGSRSARSTSFTVVHAHEGSHCHKIACCKDGGHVISCGGDGKVVIIDTVTCNIIQKVSLEYGLVAREMVCLGERSSGTTSVLLSITDRTLRCMSVRNPTMGSQRGRRVDDEIFVQNFSRGPSPSVTTRQRSPDPRQSGMRSLTPRYNRHDLVDTIGPQQQSPPRHWDASPTNMHRPAFVDEETYSPVHNRKRHEDRGGLIPQSIRTPQQLIYHCMSLLKNLSRIEEDEVGARQAVEAQQWSEWGMLLDMWRYHSSGKLSQLSGQFVRAQLDESLVRLLNCWHLSNAKLEAVVCHMKKERLTSSLDRIRCLYTAMVQSQSSERALLEESEQSTRGALMGMMHELTVLREDKALLLQQVSASDSLIAQLERKSAAFNELERQAAQVPLVTAKLSDTLEVLAIAEEEGKSTSAQLASLQRDHKETVEGLQRSHFRIRQEETRALFLEETARRRVIAAECVESSMELVPLLRRQECSELSLTAHSLASLTSEHAALSQHNRYVEALLIKQQQELREKEFAVDERSIALRKSTESCDTLREVLEDVKKRLAAAEERSTALELDAMRQAAKAEQYSSRLEQASKLAEETFQTVVEQQHHLRGLKQSLLHVKALAEAFQRATDSEVMFSADASINEVRALLREAQLDLAASRRDDGTNAMRFEDDMALSPQDWNAHADVATARLRLQRANASVAGADNDRFSSRPKNGSNDASSMALVVTPEELDHAADADSSAKHLSRAFAKVHRAQSLVGPQWCADVVVLKKALFREHLGKILSVAIDATK